MSELLQSEGINLNALDSMVYSYMLCEGFTEESSMTESGRDMKKKAYLIRDLIIAGELAEAMDIIQEVSPDLLKDPLIQFRLKKQKLIELLRKKNNASEEDALVWMKKELAPSALEAFPEAYSEFKKTLLMFVYDESEENSPVAFEWSSESRLQVADLIFSTLKFNHGFKDPDLVNLLKYLLIHAKKWQQEDTSDREKQLLRKISVDSRMPAPILIGGENPAFILTDEDITAIMSGTNVPQNVAEDALKRGKGDVSAAFESELGRYQINHDELNTLVLEYAGYRGMLQFSESESEDVEEMKESVELKEDPPVKKLKRSGYKCDPNLKCILRLLRKVKNGKYLEIIEKTKEIDSTLHQRYPQLLFELWRFEVLRIANLGNHDVALDLLRKNLAPLVKSNNDLFLELQKTLNFIMSSKAEHPSNAFLCSTLQAALQESMNLPGPQLIHFMKFLLERHQDWFKKQDVQDIFSKNLGIDVLLHGSSEIRLSPSIPPPPPPPERSNEGWGDTVDSMEWGSASSEESLDISEEAIAQVMSILNFPRDHAIDLLRQHEGNLELAVNQVLTQSDEQ